MASPPDPDSARRRPGRPLAEPATPSALAPALLRWGREAGFDVELLASAGAIDVADADRDEVPIRGSALARMLARAAELGADPHLALRLPHQLARTLAARRFDAGGLAARAAETPRAVLSAVARYAPLVFPRLEGEVRDEEGAIALHTRIAGAPRGLGHHVDAYVLAFVLAHCRRGEAPVRPVRVWLATPRPTGDLGAYTSAFGTDEIEFGHPDTGLALDPAAAALALPSVDPMLVAAAEHVAALALASAPRSTGLAGVVRARIEAALATGEVTAESVAEGLRMSSRTLQRRLEDEGIRFSVLLDEVRERGARTLLADPALPLAEIGARLGFSDLAAFSRAFKRWTGVPPGAFRRSGAAKPGASR